MRTDGSVVPLPRLDEVPSDRARARIGAGRDVHPEPLDAAQGALDRLLQRLSLGGDRQGGAIDQIVVTQLGDVVARRNR